MADLYQPAKTYLVGLLIYVFFNIGVSLADIINTQLLSTIFLLSAWVRNFTMLISVYAYLELMKTSIQSYENRPQLQTLIEMFLIDEHYIGNLMSSIAMIYYCYSQYVCQNNSWLSIVEVSQCTLCLFSQLIIKLRYEQFPFYKLDYRKSRITKAKIAIRIFVAIVLFRVWVYLIQAISDLTLSVVTIFVSVIVQTFGCTIISWGIIQDLNELKPEAINSENFKCYNGWMTLLISLSNLQQYRIIRTLIIVTIFVQSAVFLGGPGFTIYYINIETTIMMYITLYWLVFELARTVQIKLKMKVSQDVVYDKTQDQIWDHNFDVLPLPSVGERDEIIWKRLQMVQNKECTICLQPMTQDLIPLDCHEAHIFHSICIREWKRHMNMCPLCRHPILNNVK